MKEKYRIKKLWSDANDRWVYYIEVKGIFFWHRVKSPDTWYGFENVNGVTIPVTDKDDTTRYFRDEEKATDYILKHFTEKYKTVRIFQVE